MLTPHRRHLATCEHKEKGWNYTLCGCPIWTDGKLNGRRYRKSLDTTSWERAIQRIQLLEGGGELLPDTPESPNVARARDAYLKDCRKRNLEASTIASYERTLAHLVKRLGDRPVGSIDVATLGAGDSRELKPRTLRKEIEHLRAFFAWCQDREWHTKNPAAKLRMPKVEDVATLPFEPDEVAALLAACDQIASDDPGQTPYIRHRARALVYALLYTGLRVSDVARLRRAALDPATGHLTLRVTKTGVPLKILLHPDAKAVLESLPAANPEYFFWTGCGQVERCAKNMWRTAQRLGKLAKVERNGAKVSVHAHPHRFRDTFAVELLTQGVDIRTVQKLLGHESVQTTEKHYAHFVAAHQQILDSAAARLDFGSKPARPVLMRPRQKRLRNT